MMRASTRNTRGRSNATYSVSGSVSGRRFTTNLSPRSRRSNHSRHRRRAANSPALGSLILILLIRNAQRRREWDHAERMKALEMGLPVPPRDSPWAKASVCIAIGVVVPLLAFGFTAGAYHDRPGAPDELWIVPGFVTPTCVVVASILAGVLFRDGSRSADPEDVERSNARQPGPIVKSSHDPDAFDVVGRRG
jgi:hypothetical protein